MGKRDRGWVGRFVALVAGLAVVATACGDSRFQYVQNADEGVYLKIPADWSVSEGTEIIPEPRVFADILARPLEPELSAWQVTMLAPARGTLDPPQGFVNVETLDRRQRDQVSVSSLRARVSGLRSRPSADDDSEPVGVDPLAAEQNAQTTELIEVFHDGEIVTDTVRGNRVIYAVTLESLPQPLMFDQTVLMSLEGDKLYNVDIHCSLACYEAFRDDINDVVASFTVED